MPIIGIKQYNFEKIEGGFQDGEDDILSW